MSRNTKVAAIAALAGILAGGALSTVAAHHGGAIEWGEQTLGPLTATATKFAFQFPHVYISANVAAGADAGDWTLVTRWTPTILREHGWSGQSIKPGDTLAVTYLAHVTTPRIGSIVSIEVNGKPLPIDF